MKRMLASDVRIVLEELGRVLRIFSFVALIAVVIPVIFREYHAVLYFLITSGVAFVSSHILALVHVEEEPKIRHAMIVAALA
ncbi:MAG: hypothetical protein HXS40_12390, partial [Theionarchaea archaeon]|nr:hypothetical protein [Theionarchaea archaeon]